MQTEILASAVRDVLAGPARALAAAPATATAAETARVGDAVVDDVVADLARHPDLAPKSPLASRTVIGGAIAVAAGLAGLFGYAVSEADRGFLADGLADLVALLGGLAAVVGRIRASRPIG